MKELNGLKSRNFQILLEEQEDLEVQAQNKNEVELINNPFSK
jgi:hypothetical protein